MSRRLRHGLAIHLLRLAHWIAPDLTMVAGVTFRGGKVLSRNHGYMMDCTIEWDAP